MWKYWWSVMQLNAVLLFSVAGVAVAEGTAPHGRVSYDAGGTMLAAPGNSEWAFAPMNTLVFSGDQIWADKGSASEIEFQGGKYLRLADQSRAEIERLNQDGVQVRAIIGSFYVHRLQGSTGSFVLETPASKIEFSSDCLVRVDVEASGSTVVTVQWGEASVYGNAREETVAGRGTRVWIDPGLLPSEPRPIETDVSDAFDKWNRERVEYLNRGLQTLPSSINVKVSSLGVADLSHYGEWVTVQDRVVWRPTVVVDYVPYRYGYWSYAPTIGYVWVDDFPFAYVTCHYGRWLYYDTYGWVWAYDPVWAPAWVATVRCGDYLVWAPLDFYDRPVFVQSSAYFSIGGVRFCIAATSYVPCTYVTYGPYYIRPCEPYFVDYVRTVPVTQVNIWNIYVNSPRYEGRYRVPFDSSVTRVWDYRPTRAIRGLERWEGRSYSATDRARALEASLSSQVSQVTRSVRASAGERTVISSDRLTTFRRTELTNTDAPVLRAIREAGRVRADEVSPSRRLAGSVESTSKVPSVSSRFVRETPAATRRSEGQAAPQDLPSETLRGTRSSRTQGMIPSRRNRGATLEESSTPARSEGTERGPLGEGGSILPERTSPRSTLPQRSSGPRQDIRGRTLRTEPPGVGLDAPRSDRNGGEQDASFPGMLREGRTTSETRPTLPSARTPEIPSRAPTPSRSSRMESAPGARSAVPEAGRGTIVTPAPRTADSIERAPTLRESGTSVLPSSPRSPRPLQNRGIPSSEPSSPSRPNIPSISADTLRVPARPSETSPQNVPGRLGPPVRAMPEPGVRGSLRHRSENTSAPVGIITAQSRQVSSWRDGGFVIAQADLYDTLPTQQRTQPRGGFPSYTPPEAGPWYGGGYRRQPPKVESPSQTVPPPSRSSSGDERRYSLPDLPQPDVQTSPSRPSPPPSEQEGRRFSLPSVPREYTQPRDEQRYQPLPSPPGRFNSPGSGRVFGDPYREDGGIRVSPTPRSSPLLPLPPTRPDRRGTSDSPRMRGVLPPLPSPEYRPESPTPPSGPKFDIRPRRQYREIRDIPSLPRWTPSQQSSTLVNFAQYQTHG